MDCVMVLSGECITCSLAASIFGIIVCSTCPMLGMLRWQRQPRHILRQARWCSPCHWSSSSNSRRRAASPRGTITTSTARDPSNHTTHREYTDDTTGILHHQVLVMLYTPASHFIKEVYVTVMMLAWSDSKHNCSSYRDATACLLSWVNTPTLNYLIDSCHLLHVCPCEGEKRTTYDDLTRILVYQRYQESTELCTCSTIVKCALNRV